jgi:hypothetical protein
MKRATAEESELPDKNVAHVTQQQLLDACAPTSRRHMRRLAE